MINLELTREEADVLLTALKYEIMDAEKRIQLMKKHGSNDLEATRYTRYQLMRLVKKLEDKGIVS